MSKYGYNSDSRQGERAFERNGRYGYDEQRYLGHGKEARDYQRLTAHPVTYLKREH